MFEWCPSRWGNSTQTAAWTSWWRNWRWWSAIRPRTTSSSSLPKRCSTLECSEHRACLKQVRNTIISGETGSSVSTGVNIHHLTAFVLQMNCVLVCNEEATFHRLKHFNLKLSLSSGRWSFGWRLPGETEGVSELWEEIWGARSRVCVSDASPDIF